MRTQSADAIARHDAGTGELRGAVLQVEALSVRLGGVDVLRDVSFAVDHGTSLAVIGPNGAGKTVLFRALIGAQPHRGSVRWADGVRLGYVPQKLDLERDLPLTGRDFLAARASVARADEAEIARSLELVGLGAALASRPIGTLSGGQFQRLLLAFALIGAPQVLLFDEPTAGIDAPGQEELYETIHRLQVERQLTLLLISHELSVVYRYADRVLCLGGARPYLGVPSQILTPERIREVYGSERFHHHGG